MSPAVGIETMCEGQNSAFISHPYISTCTKPEFGLWTDLPNHSHFRIANDSLLLSPYLYLQASEGSLLLFIVSTKNPDILDNTCIIEMKSKL